MRIDARVPVRLVPDGTDLVPEPDAVLVVVGKGGPWAPDREAGWAAARLLPEAALAGRHGGDCRCCGGRTGFSELMGLLFRDRATGILPFFASVVVRLPRSHEDAAAESLGGDTLLSSRYRLVAATREN